MEITIMKLQETANLDARGYYDLLHKYQYTDDAGIGFKDLNIEENNTVSGVAIKRTAILINVFDINTESIVKREQFIISEIDFVIDPENKLIEIYSSSKEVKKVITTFLNTVDSFVQLEPLLLQPSQLLNSLKSQTISCEINKLLIRDFSSEKGVNGNYDIKNIDNNLAWKFIDIYKNEVVRASLIVIVEDIEASIQLFQNGKFKITTKPRNNSNKIIDIVKNIISNK